MAKSTRSRRRGKADIDRAVVYGQAKLRPLQPGHSADNLPAVGPAGTVHTTLADFTRYMARHLAFASRSEVTKADKSRASTPLISPGNIRL